MPTVFVVRVPLTVVFSNLMLEGIERLWEVHDFLPDPKQFFLQLMIIVSRFVELTKLILKK